MPQPVHLTPEGHAENKKNLLYIIPKKMNLPMGTIGYVPRAELDEVLADPTMTFYYFRSYDYFASWQQVYVCAHALSLWLLVFYPLAILAHSFVFSCPADD